MSTRTPSAPALRHRIPAVAVGVALTVAACVPKDYPDNPLFEGSGSLPPPKIAPVAPILDAAGAAASADRTGEARAELQQRGADLRARADALRTAQP